MNVRDDIAFWAKILNASDVDRVVKLNGYQFKAKYNANGLVQSFVSRSHNEWRSSLMLIFENSLFRFTVNAVINIVDSNRPPSDFHELPMLHTKPFNPIVFRIEQYGSHKLELFDWTEDEFDSMVMSLYLKLKD
jgi:hypothetical protein